MLFPAGASPRPTPVKIFAESFDNFCKAVTLSSLFSEHFANTKEKAQKISDFLADFAPILSDFENAFKDKDTVLIGDLSEYEIAPRREGDIAQCYADTEKSFKELGWKAEMDIARMCADSWNFTKNNLMIYILN